jgi:hypothetical protein
MNKTAVETTTGKFHVRGNGLAFLKAGNGAADTRQKSILFLARVSF